MILKGYIFSRPFFGERLPQHVQNIVLRDYCKKKKINFLLSATEYTFKNSTYILEELLDKWKKQDGLVFYSLFQLPIDYKKRSKFYKRVLKDKKEIHFVLENLIAKDVKSFLKVEEIFKIKLSKTNNEITKFKIGKLRNIISQNHKKTKRNYIYRMNDEKIKCMNISKKYDHEYWDGNRKYGYGGYKYIPGYHSKVAKKLIKIYNLNNNSKILDVGCGKGFLMHEIYKILPRAEIVGIDISKYAKNKSLSSTKKKIYIHDINKNLKFKNDNFDLVISINTLHNLKLENLSKCLNEIDRVGKKKFICIESYRNNKEQFNLQCWALTAETLIDTNSWKWMFEQSKYSGDYEFIFFE